MALVVLSFMGGSMFEFFLFEFNPSLATSTEYETGLSVGYQEGYDDAAAMSPWFVRMCQGEGGFATCWLIPMLLAAGVCGVAMTYGYLQGRKVRA